MHNYITDCKHSNMSIGYSLQALATRSLRATLSSHFAASIILPYAISRVGVFISYAKLIYILSIYKL